MCISMSYFIADQNGCAAFQSPSSAANHFKMETKYSTTNAEFQHPLLSCSQMSFSTSSEKESNGIECSTPEKNFSHPSTGFPGHYTSSASNESNHQTASDQYKSKDHERFANKLSDNSSNVSNPFKQLNRKPKNKRNNESNPKVRRRVRPSEEGLANKSNSPRWTQKDLYAALQLVKSGTPIKPAAEKCNMPVMTLWRRTRALGLVSSKVQCGFRYPTRTSKKPELSSKASINVNDVDNRQISLKTSTNDGIKGFLPIGIETSN